MTTELSATGWPALRAEASSADGAVPTAFGRPVSRRSMLRGLGVTGLGALLAPLLTGTAFAAPPDRADRRGPASKPKKVGGGTAVQPTPYTVQASSELSREFFVTSEVMIQTGDDIYPFVNPKNGNQVEALVFASGTLNHLRRDTTATTGWTYAAFDLQGLFTSVNDIAIAANGTDVYALLFGTPDPANNESNAPAWLTKLTGPASWDAGTLATFNDLGINGSQLTGSVKGGISREGVPYFYTALQDGTLAGWAYTGNWNYSPLAYQQYLQPDTSQASVDDFTILYDTNTSDVNNPTGFAVVRMSNGDLSVYPQDGETFADSPLTNAGTTGVTELMWAWASPASTTGLPGYAFQTSLGTGFVDENGIYNTVADVALAAKNAVTVWQQDGLYTVNLLDSDGTLQMIQELSSSGAGSWATPIPLIPDLQAVFGVPTDPNENTLFAVGLDETLSVLSLGSTGWTQTQVHQAGESEDTYDFAAYRVQATITDANGTAVPGAQVSICADRPVGAWTPTGNLPITPDTPLTVTADVKGEITFSIPAEELDAAMLTVQALDPSGNHTGSALSIMPDTDLRGFLGGTGALTDLGTLTGATLTAATQPGTSTLLFPTLTDSDSAAASVTALNQLIKTGTDAQNNTITSGTAFTLDLSSGKPVYNTTTIGKGQLGGRALTFSFGHLFDSIGHAIRHGAMELSKAVIHLAEDGVHWAVDLALKIGDDIVNFTDLVITDMKSAFHVIGGFFNTLGADIKDAVDWLKDDVIGLVEAAAGSASQLQSWFVDLGTNITSVLNQIEINTDTWFSDKEAQAHLEISNLKNLVEGTLGGPTLPTPTDTGSSSDESHLGKDLSYIGKVMNDAPGTWLLHKLMSYLPATDTGPTIDQNTFEPLLQQLATDWVDAMALADSVWNFVQTTMVDAFSTNGLADKGKLTDTQVTAWFTDLDTVVHNGLQLLNALADTFLDLCKTAVALIEDYFVYQYNVVSSMGIIGFILEKAGVDIHFSLSEILSWIIAFPATLIAKCRGYSALFPSTVDIGSRHQGHARQPRELVGKAPDGWQVGLGIVGAVAQGVWGFADMVGDLHQFYDSDSGQRGTPSGLIDYFDILCPLVETVALWPSEPNSDGTASYPFHGGIATSTTYAELLPFVIWSAVLPSVFGAVAKAGWTDNLSNSGFPSGVQDVAKDYMGPFVQMIAGTVNTVLGGIYSGKNDAGWVAILGTVLGNLSFIGAPLATKVMAESTDDISTLVKMLIDAVGNIGAAVCIAEATSLPTPG